ncbi:MAG: ABA4-like family protein [Actinomycetota bacterium]|nr:ABA4-like family protein [Actinomycetota bacterium]
MARSFREAKKAPRLGEWCENRRVGDFERMTHGRRRVYLLLNGSVVPFWLAMILAPRSRLTARLMQAATPLFAGLGVTYDALLVGGSVKHGEVLDFADPDAVRAALSTPDIFLAGWTHYLAFDLFVGRWMWEDALARDRTPRLALLLTFLAGPAGLSLYLAQRRAWG